MRIELFGWGWNVGTTLKQPEDIEVDYKKHGWKRAKRLTGPSPGIVLSCDKDGRRVGKDFVVIEETQSSGATNQAKVHLSRIRKP